MDFRDYPEFEVRLIARLDGDMKTIARAHFMDETSYAVRVRNVIKKVIW